jgi:hypothetical protein
MFKITINMIAVFLLAIAVCPAFADAQCVAPPSGMTNWWTADDHAFDIIGGEHGSLQGGATYATGKVARAFSLDGVDDHVLVQNSSEAAFNFDGSFTIDAWIYLDSYAPQFSPIVSKWNDIPFGNDERSYFFAVDTPSFNGGRLLRFDVSTDGNFVNGNNGVRFSNAPIPTNTWTHVAAVFDGTAHTLSLYINGQLANGPYFGPDNLSVPFATDEPLLIGAGDLGSDQRDFFDGRIDEVELFDRAVSGAELQSLYQAGSFGKTIPVEIDIKPGDEPNSINLGSNGKVPVAILSSETFDATTMDVASITFAGAPVAPKKNGTYMASLEDVNGDARLDLVLHFSTQDLMLTSSSIQATLTGTTTMGRCTSATDSVNIVP